MLNQEAVLQVHPEPSFIAAVLRNETSLEKVLLDFRHVNKSLSFESSEYTTAADRVNKDCSPQASVI